MNETMILQNLEAIAEKLGVQVNYENLKKKHVYSKGGLCRLKEDKLVIVDSNLHLSEKIDILADALSQFNLEDIYMPPAVRKILAKKDTTTIIEEKDSSQEQEGSELKDSSERSDTKE